MKIVGKFYGQLTYFTVILVYFSRFGMLYQDKSCNETGTDVMIFKYFCQKNWFMISSSSPDAESDPRDGGRPEEQRRRVPDEGEGSRAAARHHQVHGAGLRQRYAQGPILQNPEFWPTMFRDKFTHKNNIFKFIWSTVDNNLE
jgi:hypothetical protein